MRWTSWQRRRSSSQSVKVGFTHPKGSRNPWPCWRQISTSRLFTAGTSRCSRASRLLVHARATPPRRKSGTNEAVSSAGDPAKRPAGDVNVDFGENPPGRGVGRRRPGGDGGGPSMREKRERGSGGDRSLEKAAAATGDHRKRCGGEYRNRKWGGAGNLSAGREDRMEGRLRGNTGQWFVFFSGGVAAVFAGTKGVDPPPVSVQQGRVARLQSAAIPAP